MTMHINFRTAVVSFDLAGGTVPVDLGVFLGNLAMAAFGALMWREGLRCGLADENDEAIANALDLPWSPPWSPNANGRAAPGWTVGRITPTPRPHDE